MARNRELEKFYNSKEWKLSRQYKLASVNYRCERCGGIAVEVHHKIPISPENRHNPSIMIGQNNLEAICLECHNKEHKRFRQSNINFDENGNIKPYK
jgi:5-methylcytosine-specific restriction endonuclease McrA